MGVQKTDLTLVSWSLGKSAHRNTPHHQEGGWALLDKLDEVDIVEAYIIKVLSADMCSTFQTKHSCQGALRAHKTRCMHKRWRTSAAGRANDNDTQQLDNLLLRFSVHT